MEEKKNIFTRMRDYLKEVRGEMKKVNWPGREDLVKTTIAVIVSSIFFGVYLFGVDFVIAGLINLIQGKPFVLPK